MKKWLIKGGTVLTLAAFLSLQMAPAVDAAASFSKFQNFGKMKTALFGETRAICPVFDIGDRIKLEGAPAIYLLNESREIMPFTSEKVYKSWYDDFEGIKDVDLKCLDSLTRTKTDPRFVTFRPGTTLVKRSWGSKVYVVVDGNTLVHIKDAAVAKRVFGDTWESRINVIEDHEWMAYETADFSYDGSYPLDGMLVKTKNGTAIVRNGMYLGLEDMDGVKSKNILDFPVAAKAYKNSEYPVDYTDVLDNLYGAQKSPEQLELQKKLKKAVLKSLEVESGSFVAKATGKENGDKFVFEYSGDFNAKDTENTMLDLNASYEITAEDLLVDFSGNLKLFVNEKDVSDNDVYFKLHTAEYKEPSGEFALSEDLLNVWIGLSDEAKELFVEADDLDVYEELSETEEEREEIFEDLFDIYPFIFLVEKVGESTVAGVNSDKYEYAVDVNVYKRFARAYTKALDEKSDLYASDFEDMLEFLLAAQGQLSTSASGNIWIGDDGYVRKVQYTDDSNGVDVNFSLTLSNQNKDIVVSKPVAKMTFEEFFEAIMAELMGGVTINEPEDDIFLDLDEDQGI